MAEVIKPVSLISLLTRARPPRGRRQPGISLVFSRFGVGRWCRGSAERSKNPQLTGSSWTGASPAVGRSRRRPGPSFRRDLRPVCAGPVTGARPGRRSGASSAAGPGRRTAPDDPAALDPLQHTRRRHGRVVTTDPAPRVPRPARRSDRVRYASSRLLRSFTLHCTRKRSVVDGKRRSRRRVLPTGSPQMPQNGVTAARGPRSLAGVPVVVVAWPGAALPEACPGHRPARGALPGGSQRRGLSKSATKARIEPERARRIVDIPRFSSRPIPARGAFVADLDTLPLRIATGAPPAPHRARPSPILRRPGLLSRRFW